MSRVSALLGLVAWLVVIPACGPTAPSSVTGTWNGTWNDPLAGPATITLTMTQSGTALAGTWSIQFPTAVFAVTGSLSGTLNGTNLTATFTADNPAACDRNIAATVDKTSMKGMYAYANCSTTETGSLSLNEQ